MLLHHAGLLSSRRQRLRDVWSSAYSAALRIFSNSVMVFVPNFKDGLLLQSELCTIDSTGRAT